MESSPLVKAHDHARAAAVATRQASDTTVAINEHAQAAGEFANAAQSTSSIEALRTLKLLEEHHRKLAELLRLPAEPSPPAEAETSEKPRIGKGPATAEDAHAKKEAGGEYLASKAAQMPGFGQQRRYASREMSSSIASNLASARGIRSKYRGQPLVPSVSNDQAPGNVNPHPRRDGPKTKMRNIIEHQPGKPTWVPPMTPSPMKPESRSRTSSSARSSPRADPSPNATEDGGYARFYNTFGSIINKISAPLAFAGLPLLQEESTASEQAEPSESPLPKRNRVKRTSSSTLEPDLSKIYSKATMRALAREGHRPNDSFYVVPTSGHTMSYANILSFAEKEKRRLEASSHGEPSNLLEDDEDDFVDARESPVPLSPGAKRRIGRARSDKELSNTIEELYMENMSLKDMLDKLTKRLHAFEASAQSSAMALAESYRFMRPGSPVPTGTANTSDDTTKKTQELQEQLAATMKQMERLEKDNRKMQKTLEKYREKWELLKAGAKARREAQGAGESVEDAAQA